MQNVYHLSFLPNSKNVDNQSVIDKQMIREEEDEEEVMKTICITLQKEMNCATAAEEENYYYNIILDADLIESVKIVLCAKRTRTDRVQQQQTDIYIRGSGIGGEYP